MKRIIASLILVLGFTMAWAGSKVWKKADVVAATASDSLKRDMEDYDYLVSFVEKNYAPFDAIMQKGYKREYKAMKKQLRKQLSNGKVGLEKAASDYALWFYSQFDHHILLESDTFAIAAQIQANEAIIKLDSTLVTNPGTFKIAPMPVSCKVDSLTWLIRIPSCEPEFYNSTMNALQQFLASECENLIIDIRWNGGGSDNVWEGYYDLLYDHPSQPEVGWIRNTPKNLLFRKSMPSNDFNRQLIEKCETSKDKFVKQWETDGNLERQPSSRIKRAAILINFATASAAESLVQFAKKHSDRAKVYGIGKTAGCDLTGDCRTELLPNSKLGVLYATTIDSGFYEKDFSSEGLGIHPDVILPLPMERKLTDNIDEWVLWVAKDLKN